MQQNPKKTLKISFGQINDKNVNLLRKLNYQTFPVKYSTPFYIKLVMQYTQLSKFAYYNDIVIGAHTVRIQDYKSQPHAYILTFGVLEPYRKFNIGKQMMQQIQKDLIQKHPQVVAIYLHMHVINQGGKKFYQKCGFQVQQRLQNYYTDLQEPHCFILKKKITKKESST